MRQLYPHFRSSHHLRTIGSVLLICVPLSLEVYICAGSRVTICPPSVTSSVTSDSYDSPSLSQRSGRTHLISVVIPVFNEEESLLSLYQGLVRVFDDLRQPWELVIVDDGSSDSTFAVSRSISHRDPHVNVVRLKRNFGQTCALAAGFEYARGDVIVTMDGDLQNDPSDIPRLLSKLDEGYDIVSGWRRARKDRLFAKRLPSLLSNRLTSWITGIPLHDFGCTLKAYRREVVADIHLYSDFHRFIPALASTMGARVAEVEVAHSPRQHGTSKYGYGRIVRGLLDILTLKLLISYNARPMQMFGGLGLLTAAAAVVSGTATLITKFVMGVDVTGNPLLFLTMLLFLTATQFIGLGFLGDLSARTYHEIQRRPTYVVREWTGVQENGSNAVARSRLMPDSVATAPQFGRSVDSD